MPDPSRDAALDAYQAALAESTEANLEALRAHVIEEVEVVGVVGPGRGFDQVRHALANPRRPGFLAGATWSRADGPDGEVELTATLPDGGLAASLTAYVAFDGSRIARVEQLLQMASPPPATALVLTDAMRATVDGALVNGTPLTLAYVDAAGTPHLSLRGSTSVHGGTALAIWVRDRSGGLLAAIASNPNVALQYRDPATATSYQFTGRAHVEEDPAARDAVYARAPAPEQNLDARRRGAVVVVELDKVEGMGPQGRVRMAREP